MLTGNAAVELGAEGEGMVLGDTVNTASRLQSLAEPGTVLVDDVTRRASEAAIEYEDAGTHPVKGREQPVHACTALRVVAGVRGARRSAGLEAPFVGRERELQTIIDVSEDTIAHNTARLVTVTGDAGSGKSRLLWEFFKYVDGIEAGRWWHQGRCLSYGEGVSYWALAEMVRARAGITDEDDPSSEREKLRAAVETVRDRRARAAAGRAQARPPARTRAAQRDARRPTCSAGWRLFFERMADGEPGDPRLRGPAVGRLRAAGLHRLPARVVGRLSDLHPRSRALRARVTSSQLGHLDAALARWPGRDAGVARWARSRACPRISQREILDRAEGVPLYAVETVRMLLDRGVLHQEGNRYVVSGTIGDLEVPETLQALVAATT